MADFHSKMSVCRHELGVQPPNPPTIPTLRFGSGDRRRRSSTDHRDSNGPDYTCMPALRMYAHNVSVPYCTRNQAVARIADLCLYLQHHWESRDVIGHVTI